MRLPKVELDRTLDRFDYILAVSLVLLIAVYSSIYFDFAAYPAEDPAILMRYSQHLAQGHGIVWNVGEEPIDGATDFLPMVLFAVATYGDDPQDVQHHYVRRGFPDGTYTAKRICKMDYRYPSSVSSVPCEATNYATDKVCNDK